MSSIEHRTQVYSYAEFRNSSNSCLLASRSSSPLSFLTLSFICMGHVVRCREEMSSFTFLPVRTLLLPSFLSLPFSREGDRLCFPLLPSFLPFRGDLRLRLCEWEGAINEAEELREDRGLELDRATLDLALEMERPRRSPCPFKFLSKRENRSLFCRLCDSNRSASSELPWRRWRNSYVSLWGPEWPCKGFLTQSHS